ncbi:HepT-like ribonuclease domain-containing protein [Sphingomonas faeni]|uniref:HepT-like ribonuclease domain-containing protein n=1 Tax=Sphingomonas faeni TaxID=185950 RepID=UPI0027D7FDE9|nr:HepT-like ribonuclease domain-containing protein [Sphingomonas faeni]
MDDYLELLRQGVQDVTTCTCGIDLERFRADRVRQLAVVKAIENIGETPGDVLADYPVFAEREKSIAWRAWKGARNRLAHGYHSIDYDLVWGMAERDVPKLGQALQEIADFEVVRLAFRQAGKTPSK